VKSLAHIRRNARTIATHHVGAALIALVNYGFGFWLPTFFERTHGWTPSRAGYLLGVANLTFGIAGVSLAGRLSDRWQARGYGRRQAQGLHARRTRPAHL
jgi:MFS family permease